MSEDKSIRISNGESQITFEKQMLLAKSVAGFLEFCIKEAMDYSRRTKTES